MKIRRRRVGQECECIIQSYRGPDRRGREHDPAPFRTREMEVESGCDHHARRNRMNPGIVLAAHHSDYARNGVMKTANASGKLKRTSLHGVPLLALWVPHNRIARRFILVSGFPLRAFAAIRNFIPDYVPLLTTMHR